MIISLDYDDTVTKYPEFWSEFVHQATQSGHTVHIVTARMDTMIQDIIDWRDYLEAKVFATNLQPKRAFMLKQGILIDVWIDDSPEAIVAPIYLGFEK
jgi:isopentenyl diphosphate isomerase/L-lactate dehydrogenase-like FMN-dependent dehydrogenase